jgi:hypothetical protein
MVTITVFVTRNPQGRALLQACEALASELFGSEVRIIEGRPTSAGLVSAALTADAVIFDATPDPEGEHLYGLMHNGPMSMDHVLMVSRSYLPVNVAVRRVGGAPIYPRTQDNDAIAGWIREQFRGPDNVLIPRPGKEKLKLGLTLGFSAVREAGKVEDQRRESRNHVFISYRGSRYDVASWLRDEIESGRFDGNPRPVYLYAPDELAVSDEVLAAMMRWNVLSVISDVIFTCREFWIVASDDYWESWWTRGEVYTYAYAHRTDPIRVYDPTLDRVVNPADQEFVVQLTSAQRDRMVRYFTNSHPHLMAPEARESMRLWRGVLNPKHFSMPYDEVFTDDFWETPLLQCYGCNAVRSAGNLDVDAFLANEYPLLHPVKADVLNAAMESGGALPCPNPQCPAHAQFRIIAAPPRFLWYPLPVGRNHSYLEAIPAYRAQSATAP